jgi:hypothetical protein
MKNASVMAPVLSFPDGKAPQKLGEAPIKIEPGDQNARLSKIASSPEAQLQTCRFPVPAFSTSPGQQSLQRCHGVAQALGMNSNTMRRAV